MIQNNILKKSFSFVTVLLISWNGFSQKNISKIAFGSCSNQSNPLPIFDVVVKHQPDLFVFLGDNIYGDTDNMNTLQLNYYRLAAKPTFQNLKKNVTIIATRDDHYYGQNDAGRQYLKKRRNLKNVLIIF